ncbi:MAG: Lrp/AsnC family transcriptional regulator [Thaumarchaeota archaeon]|nr:Lrp/AsnC family transcriptional regulator [Nitrososphaerota archaeon]
MQSGNRNLDKAQGSGAKRTEETGRTGIDRLDAKILREIQREGRVPYRRVAGRLGVSTTTVSARVSNLMGRKVVRGFSADIDFQKVGYEITAVTEILVSKGKLLEMEREIARLPGVCAVYDVTGEIDGIVVAKFRDREELSRFTKGLMAMPFVDRANTHVVLTTVREDFRLPL